MSDARPFDETLDELRTLRDELRIKAHLMGMDLQDFLEKQEPKLRAAQQRFEAAAEEAAAHRPQLETAARELLDEVKAAWSDARARLKR